MLHLLLLRAWLDGPHEEILEYLVVERDRLMSIDVRVATINDRTILAVAQVVQMCKGAQVNRIQMTNIIAFKPRQKLDAQENLDAFGLLVTS